MSRSKMEGKRYEVIDLTHDSSEDEVSSEEEDIRNVPDGPRITSVIGNVDVTISNDDDDDDDDDNNIEEGRELLRRILENIRRNGTIIQEEEIEIPLEEPQERLFNWLCQLCNARFAGRPELKQHLSETHRMNLDSVSLCPPFR